MTIRKLSALPLIALLLFLLALPAVGNEGECPEGYAEISTGFDGLSWTADADYQTVILVGGPPNDNNQDPDGRDKTFTDVEEGDVIARVAHDISHICVGGGSSTTTTSTDPTTTTTAGTTTAPTTAPTSTTSTTLDPPTTTSIGTTTTSQTTSTSTTVPPSSTTSPVLPFTGVDTGLPLVAAAGLILVGSVLAAKGQRV